MSGATTSVGPVVVTSRVTVVVLVTGGGVSAQPASANKAGANK
jgi:hypothetical protein